MTEMIKIEKRYGEIRGEYLAPSTWDQASILQELGLACYVSGLGVEVHESLVERLGWEFTVDQAVELFEELERVRKERAERKAKGLFKCDCGHVVAKALVMNTSTGSACPDCYDRMSH